MTGLIDILRLVAEAHDLDVSELRANRKLQALVRPRAMAAYAMAKVTGASNQKIGEALNRDMSTIKSMLKTFEEHLKKDQELRIETRSLVIAAEHKITNLEITEIDVLALARAVAANPRRQAVQVSVVEVTALAVTFIDVWEIVSATELAFLEYEHAELDIRDPEIARKFSALRAAILDEINLIAGPPEPVPAKPSRQAVQTTPTTNNDGVQ